MATNVFAEQSKNAPHLGIFAKRPMAQRFEETIETNFTNQLDYSGYLRLDPLLDAQHQLSQPARHDELLFIIQHQTSELWMKLAIHELKAAVELVKKDNLEPCFKILSRVKQIQRILFEQWSVLETMTPTEYAEFRGALGHASGLQSYQNRMIEFLLGNKDARLVEVFRHSERIYSELCDLLNSPSLYDEFLRHLHRRGMAIPQETIERQWTLPYQVSAEVIEVFRLIYSKPSQYWDAYEMCEKLIDVEEYYSLWRFRHLKTVERIIGFKHGTGGSSGAPFLKKGLDIRLFPELWDVRTFIKG